MLADSSDKPTASAMAEQEKQESTSSSFPELGEFQAVPKGVVDSVLG